MRLFGASLFAALLPLVRSNKIPDALDCHDPGDVDECAQPIADVTAVVPGSSYIAKIECKDCPFIIPGDDNLGSTDYLFLLNITLTHDNRTVLLNNRPLYPLQTIPTPPPFDAAQYIPDLSNADLYRGLTSSDPYCIFSTQTNLESAEWCWKIPLWPHERPKFDYLYIAEPTRYKSDDSQDNAEYWNLSLDIIGKSLYQHDPLWEYDHPEQKMLWMLVKGTPLKTRKSNAGGGNKAADPFNGQSDTQNQKYEYQIVDMRLAARAYTFPAKKPLSVLGRVGHFFGNDVWEEQGSRFLYRQEEWGQYGKKGTLRDMFGEFVHWDSWSLFWIVFFSVIGGLLALFGFYKLFRWIVAQRELMKWDGMEDVWENMRRERLAEEEGALLNGEARYTDDPDEGSSSQPPAYEDAMKPLPSKPLPEKPLPEVPLIEA